MTRKMSRFRPWLRPPRNLLILFVLIVCLPAGTLVLLGLRLLDQDRALARQRQIELLDRAADHAVGPLEQKLLEQTKLLETRLCLLTDATDDSVCVVFRADRIEAVPPHRVPYYPLTQPLKEAVSDPFKEIESYEFRQPPDFSRALVEIKRKLALSSDPAVRAGAMLRQGRILRKMGRVNEALSAFNDLGLISSVSISGEPADLVARRTRCAILEEQARLAELRQEGGSLAADLHAGKWQLDRETFLHVSGKLNAWLGTPSNAGTGISEDGLASAVGWIYKKWTLTSPTGTNSGAHLMNSDSMPVTILWSFGGEQGAAFIANARYLELHWKAELEKAVHPARVYFAGVVCRFGALEVDFDGAVVTKNGVRVELTALEFRLLKTFVERRGRVLSREQLISAAWEHGTHVTDRVVDTHILNLRKKIEIDPSQARLLQGVRGLGYRFEGHKT